MGKQTREISAAISGMLQDMTTALDVLEDTNDSLLEKLRESNASRARLLRLRECVMQAYEDSGCEPVGYELAKHEDIETEHLLRDLEWALSKLIQYATDGEDIARAYVMAQRFSLPIVTTIQRAEETSRERSACQT